MAWTPLTPETMPPDGTVVLVTNGTDVSMAEFSSNTCTFEQSEFVVRPSEGVVTHWMPLPTVDI